MLSVELLTKVFTIRAYDDRLPFRVLPRPNGFNSPTAYISHARLEELMNLLNATGARFWLFYYSVFPC